MSAGVLSDGEQPPQPAAAASPEGIPGLRGPDSGAGSLAVDAAVNALLARAGFDLLRSAAFRERMVAHIQRKINGLRTPDYLQVWTIQCDLCADLAEV